MHAFRRTALLPLLFILFTATSSAAADNGYMETLLVTASRTPVLESMIGSSVTVIGANQLAQQGDIVLSDVLSNVPGFAVSRSGPMGALTQIRVRGAEANQVQVLIDGVKANDLSQEGEFNFAHILTSDIQRIEIVRGPQSALWGSDALAGVINIITKHGQGPVSISGFAEGGSFGTVYGGGNISGGGAAYDFRAGAQELSSAGTNISRQGSERDGYGNNTASFSAGYHPDDAFSIRATGRHISATNQFDNVNYLTGLPADSNTYTKVEQNYARLVATLKLLGGRWVHEAALDYTGDNNNNFDAGASTGRTRGRRYELQYQSSIRFALPRLSAVHNVLTLAFDRQEEDFSQRAPVTLFGDPNQDRGIHTTGLIGEYRLAVARTLSLSAGVRHDYNSAFRNDTTWRLTGSYTFNGAGTRLRGSYGSGIKDPSFTERFGYYASSPTPFFGNPDLKPERSVGWDLGVDQNLMGDRAHLKVTWFQQDLEDEINGFAYDPVRNAFTAVNTPGISHRRGLEASADAALTTNLDIRAGYTWLDATQPNSAGGQIREIRRPQNSASVNINFRFAGNRGNINLNVNYTGDQQDIFYPPYPAPARRVTLKHFTLIALAGSWRWNPKLSFYGRIENILNRRYEQVYGYRSSGIGAFAGLRFRFNP